MSVNTEPLAASFEAHRAHLNAVALRILGSHADAEDAVQEAWLRLERADASAIDNLGGWLTTVTARICLDRLRARRVRQEDAAGDLAAAPTTDPEHEAFVADGVSAALSIVLDVLSPPERVALVLHDVFAVPFDEVGAALGRSPGAAKQLASRARARVRGASLPVEPPPGQREVVSAFLAASRAGDLAGLVAVLDPDVALRADAAGARMGAPEDVLGAEAVARVFSGRALEAQAAIVDGLAGIAWAPKGLVRVVWELEIVGPVITRIDMLAAAETLDELDLVLEPDDEER